MRVSATLAAALSAALAVRAHSEDQAVFNAPDEPVASPAAKASEKKPVEHPQYTVR